MPLRTVLGANVLYSIDAWCTSDHMTDHRRTTHSCHCFGGLVRAPALGVLGNAAAGLAGNAAAAAGFDGTTAGLVSGAADARVTAAAGLGGSALLAFILPLVRPAPCAAGCGGGCGCAGAQRARPCEEAEQSVLLCAWSCHGRTASAPGGAPPRRATPMSTRPNEPARHNDPCSTSARLAMQAIPTSACGSGREKVVHCSAPMAKDGRHRERPPPRPLGL